MAVRHCCSCKTSRRRDLLGVSLLSLLGAVSGVGQEGSQLAPYAFSGWDGPSAAQRRSEEFQSEVLQDYRIGTFCFFFLLFFFCFDTKVV